MQAEMQVNRLVCNFTVVMGGWQVAAGGLAEKLEGSWAESSARWRPQVWAAAWLMGAVLAIL
jgi:hypothetical protein